MSIIAVAFLFGLLVWWEEHDRLKHDRSPTTCDICESCGEGVVCVWRRRWVHLDTGGARVTRLQAHSAELLGSVPYAHEAVPKTRTWT